MKLYFDICCYSRIYDDQGQIKRVKIKYFYEQTITQKTDYTENVFNRVKEL